MRIISIRGNANTTSSLWSLSHHLAMAAAVLLCLVPAASKVDPPPPPKSQPLDGARALRAHAILRDHVRDLSHEYENATPEIAAFYRDRGYRPRWTSPTALGPDGIDLLRYLSAANARHTDTPVAALGDLAYVAFPSQPARRLEAIAALEWSLTFDLLRLAERLARGDIDPAAVQPGWHHRGRSLEGVSFLNDAADRGPEDALDAIRRDQDFLAGLDAALVRYDSIERAGGWDPVPDLGETLEKGMRSPAVIALRARLRATGDLSPDASAPAPERFPGLFDARLDDAVRVFQTRHGLEPDGRVGRETRAALNVPSAERVRQIRVNLERRRWLPGNLGSDYVWINVPEYRLYAYRDHERVLEMKVIAGAPWNRTPFFEDELEYVVFNPYWNVPKSIAIGELLPRQRSESSYLENRGYQVVNRDAVPVSYDRLSPEAIESGAIRIRRVPGRFNDLGRVKFMMPNRYNIYLHDTPARDLFERPQRAFSHGCIRLERPMDFASFVLEGRMESREVERALRGSHPSRLALERTIPVYIVYFTAFTDDGLVHFRDDVYGLDGALGLALDGVEHRRESQRKARLEPTG